MNIIVQIGDHFFGPFATMAGATMWIAQQERPIDARTHALRTPMWTRTQAPDYHDQGDSMRYENDRNEEQYQREQAEGRKGP